MKRKNHTFELVTTYATIDMVAVSIMAYELNGYKIIKEDYAGSTAPSIVPPYPPRVSNKSHAIRLIKDPSLIAVNAKEQAATAISLLQQTNLIALLGDTIVNDFNAAMYAALEHAENPLSRMGLVIYVPVTMAKINARQALTDRISALHSVGIGNVGDKITVYIEVVTSKFASSIKCYHVLGVTGEGNLVSYTTTHVELTTSGTVKGTVKKDGPSTYHNNAIVTHINRVTRA